jgi:hypothetical protein
VLTVIGSRLVDPPVDGETRRVIDLDPVTVGVKVGIGVTQRSERP